MVHSETENDFNEIQRIEYDYKRGQSAANAIKSDESSSHKDASKCSVISAGSE